MNEAKRFLRYVTPGLAFLVLVYLYCWVLKPAETWCGLVSISGSAAQVIAASAGAGGVGFLLQSLHHALLWHVYEPMPSSWAMFDDQGPMLRIARDKRWLLVEKSSESSDPKATLESRFGAATLATVILETNRTDLKDAAERVDRLWDLLHSVGSGVVASLLAPVTALACAARMDGDFSWPWWAVLVFPIVSVLMVVVAIANYRFLVRSTNAVTSAVLISYLSSRKCPPLTVRCPVDVCWQVKWRRIGPRKAMVATFLDNGRRCLSGICRAVSRR